MSDKYSSTDKRMLNEFGVLQANQMHDTRELANSHIELLHHVKEGLKILEQMRVTFPDIATLEKFTQWQKLSQDVTRENFK